MTEKLQTKNETENKSKKTKNVKVNAACNEVTFSVSSPGKIRFGIELKYKINSIEDIAKYEKEAFATVLESLARMSEVIED